MFDKIISVAASVLGNQFFNQGSGEDAMPSPIDIEQIKTTPLQPAEKMKAYEAVDYKDLVRQWETYLTSYQQMRGKR
jgi:hypothetical protein